jgi:hypothetical protein
VREVSSLLVEWATWYLAHWRHILAAAFTADVLAYIVLLVIWWRSNKRRAA